MPEILATRFGQILQTLTRNEVRFIVIGGDCTVLHGTAISTNGLDVVHSRDPENIERALRALNALDARYRGVGDRTLRPNESH